MLCLCAQRTCQRHAARPSTHLAPMPTSPAQIRFHLPVWLGVGEALSSMIQAGKLELLQVGGWEAGAGGHVIKLSAGAPLQQGSWTAELSMLQAARGCQELPTRLPLSDPPHSSPTRFCRRTCSPTGCSSASRWTCWKWCLQRPTHVS